MKQHRSPYYGTYLWSLVVLAFAYLAWMYFWPRLTGMRLLDGSLGVVIGLFICSNPAANAVDALYAERSALQRLYSGWAGARWLGLNLLVFAMGWAMIFVGATRFVGS